MRVTLQKVRLTKTRQLARLSFLILLLTSAAAMALSAHSFDWDDNIMVMPTRIVLENQKTGERIEISSREYAVIRGLLGQPGTYQDYLRKVMETDPTRNYFREDTIKAIDGQDLSSWQGPSWKKFQAALATEASAKWTSIVTARMTPREQIYESLKWMAARGLILHLPPKENIFPVGNQTLFPGKRDVSELKVEVMETFLNSLEKEPLDNEADHTWNFSDDDPRNVRHAVAFLTEAKGLGKWPRVNLSVSFTGVSSDLPCEFILRTL